MSQPSLYEMLTGYFSGGLPIDSVDESDQVIISVMENIRRILNSRAGSIQHLPDYGLPDMSLLIQGLPGTAHNMMNILSATLLKYEPRIKSLSLVLLLKIPSVSYVTPLILNFMKKALFVMAQSLSLMDAFCFTI